MIYVKKYVTKKEITIEFLTNLLKDKKAKGLQVNSLDFMECGFMRSLKRNYSKGEIVYYTMEEIERNYPQYSGKFEIIIAYSNDYKLTKTYEIC